MSIPLLSVSVIFYVIGLFLITQSCTDFVLRRKIWGFNWKRMQWQPLTPYRAHPLNIARFMYAA